MVMTSIHTPGTEEYINDIMLKVKSQVSSHSSNAVSQAMAINRQPNVYLVLSKINYPIYTQHWKLVIINLVLYLLV